MTILDRLLIRGYIKAYLAFLVSLLSLFVIVDLFTNLDDFADHNDGLAAILRHIGSYYVVRLAYFFDRLSEVIALLAAMFTVAWMQRNNEMLPQLSAGVSTRRIVRPVLLSALAMMLLAVVNQEVVIPAYADALLKQRDDPEGRKDLEVHSGFEPNGILIKGERASRHNMEVQRFSCLIPESLGRSLIPITAERAYYYPPGSNSRGSGWLLTGARPAELEGWDKPHIMEVLDSGKYFLHTKEVTFESLTRSRTWFIFATTLQLYDELNKSDSTRLASMAVLFHMRWTRPILGLILVVMGLSVILRDQNRSVYMSAGLCLVICAIFFGMSFACKYLGDNNIMTPALAAWLPVIFFGPISLVFFDCVHT